MACVINWAPYGYAEYEMSWRVRPKHLADTTRFEHFPRRDRHCNRSSQFHRLEQTNNRMACRLFDMSNPM